jgi:hypothetical protein
MNKQGKIKSMPIEQALVGMQVLTSSDEIAVIRVCHSTNLKIVTIEIDGEEMLELVTKLRALNVICIGTKKPLLLDYSQWIAAVKRNLVDTDKEIRVITISNYLTDKLGFDEATKEKWEQYKLARVIRPRLIYPLKIVK